MRVLLVLALLFAAPVAAAEAPSHLQRTQAELARLSALPPVADADALLEQARRAVSVAERAIQEAHAPEAERALDIADAAMTLWRARRDRASARASTSAAVRRAAIAEARVQEARQALEAIRAQRAAHEQAAADAVDAGPADGGVPDAS